MEEYGNIQGYEYKESTTVLSIVIPKHIPKMNRYASEGAPSVVLKIDDGRTITADQRRKIYATIADMSKHVGHVPEVLKEIMKYWHICRTGSDYFSLSTCSVSTARSFINTLIEYCLEWQIPLSEPALLRVDEEFSFLAMCYRYKVCCICGKPGQDHHLDAIGMGRNRYEVYRDELDDEHEIIEICAVHHEEAHKLGVDTFLDKYKVFGIEKKYLERG